MCNWLEGDLICDINNHHIVVLLDITNVEYIAGKAEDAIKKTIRKYVYGMSEEEMEEEDNKRKMNNKRQAETATATAAAVATTTTMTNDSPITIDAGAGTNPDSVSTTIATTATPSSSVLTFKKPIRTTNKRVIAIMDPPRAGMHSSVIKAVRDCPAIETAIFVACDAEQSSSNWTELCRPRSNNYKGEPFQLVRVQGFDMFPQTKGFELVLEFRRGAALKAKSVMIATAAKLGSVEEEKKDVIEECL